MARIDVEMQDVPFGADEPRAKCPEVEEQERNDDEQQQPGLVDRVRSRLAERQSQKIHRLDDGRYCTHAVAELVRQGHEFLGREGWLEVREGGPGGLQRWRKYSRAVDPPVAQFPPHEVRIIAREYTRLAAGEGADPVEHDRIYMIEGSRVTCIGHRASENLLQRLRRFEPGAENTTNKPPMLAVGAVP